jgi:ribonuclease E
MTGNTDPDDGWADLARELGLEQPTRPPAPAAEAEPEETFDAGGDAEDDSEFAAADPGTDSFQEYESDGDAEADDGPDEGADGEPTGEPGEEGPKKKRRRRRRRKKKGGEAGEVAETVAGEESEEADGEVEDAANGEMEEDDEEPATPAPVDDGGPTVEASRELIANWDVPSWEQIVAGLYRPGGR